VRKEQECERCTPGSNSLFCQHTVAFYTDMAKRKARRELIERKTALETTRGTMTKDLKFFISPQLIDVY